MKSLYESDFHAWTQQQIDLLKLQAWQNLDVQNLVEELADLGRRERQELRNRWSVLLAHLLKWQYQPEHRSNSWLATIREQRTQLQLLLTENPSLKPYLVESLPIAYQLGLNIAVRETDLSYDAFPIDCPYSIEDSFNDAFLPL